jgi:hypothetical protein
MNGADVYIENSDGKSVWKTFKKGDGKKNKEMKKYLKLVKKGKK